MKVNDFPIYVLDVDTQKSEKLLNDDAAENAYLLY